MWIRGLWRMTFGKVKWFARQYVKGYGIPIFVSRKTNRAIDAHVDRIRKAKTFRRRQP